MNPNPTARTLRDVTQHEGRKFDVQPTRDPGILNWPVRPLLGAVGQVERRRKVWRRSWLLDQQSEGACVGHGWTNYLLGSPNRVVLPKAGLPANVPTNPQEFAFWHYHEDRKRDEYEGENYDGTSVNAGGKLSRELGLIDSWRWAHTREDLVDTLVTTGPVILAIPWMYGMYDAPGGELTVSGRMVGWHCILCNGYDPALALNGQPKREMARLTNSWGKGWGNNGSAWTELDALYDGLLEPNDGEMCVPLGETVTATP